MITSINTSSSQADLQLDKVSSSSSENRMSDNSTPREIRARIQSLQTELLDLQTTEEETKSSTQEKMIEDLEKEIQDLQKQLIKAEAKVKANGTEETTQADLLTKAEEPAAKSDISKGVDKLSKFQKAVSNLNDNEKTELTDLLKSAKSAMESGSFDADKLLGGVSDELKNSLKESGVDLKGTLNDLNSDYKNGQAQNSADYSPALGISGTSNSAPKAGGLMNVLLNVLGGDQSS